MGSGAWRITTSLRLNAGLVKAFRARFSLYFFLQQLQNAALKRDAPALPGELDSDTSVVDGAVRIGYDPGVKKNVVIASEFIFNF